MKRCPFCAEEIKDDAIKCRYCSEFLYRRKWFNCALGCFLVFLICVILTALFIYMGFYSVRFLCNRWIFGEPDLLYRFPSWGNGIEGIIREFVYIFRSFFDYLRDFFGKVPNDYQRITF